MQPTEETRTAYLGRPRQAVLVGWWVLKPSPKLGVRETVQWVGHLPYMKIIQVQFVASHMVP